MIQRRTRGEGNRICVLEFVLEWRCFYLSILKTNLCVKKGLFLSKNALFLKRKAMF